MELFVQQASPMRHLHRHHSTPRFSFLSGIPPLFPCAASRNLYLLPPQRSRRPLCRRRRRTRCAVISSLSISYDATYSLESGSETPESAKSFDWLSNWYPLSPICDLDRGAPTAKRVIGMDVVVWWDRAAERWQVFDDRCPHRLAPLSEGRVDKWGRLQCVYHGWCFDGSGACKFIPQAPPDGSPVHTFKKACAAVYPSFEQNKILWFWPNTDSKFKDISMTNKPPYIPELDDPSYACSMGMREINYGYEVLMENLMDPAHVPYAHHKILSIPSNKSSPSRDREGGRPLTIKVERFDATGFLSRQSLGHGKFIAPCLYYAIGNVATDNKPVSPSNSGETPQSKANQNPRRVGLIFYCVPVSPGKSRLIFSFPRNFALWIDWIVPRWIFHLMNNLVLDSDLYLLHIEEHKIAEVGRSNWLKSCYVPTESDAMVIAFRRWLRKYARNGVSWASNFSSELPPTPSKEQLLDRYWTHTMQCRSCRGALSALKAVEFVLSAASLAIIGVAAVVKQASLSAINGAWIVFFAISCFLASRCLAHFIHKNFYFHDYNHAYV